MASADVATASILVAPSENFHWLNSSLGDLLIRGLNGGTTQKILMGTGVAESNAALTVGDDDIVVDAFATFNSNVTFMSNVTIEGRLEVRDEIVLDASSTFNSNVTFMSNVTIEGRLEVNDLTYLYSNVTIYESTDIRSNLIVENDTSLGGKLVMSNASGSQSIYCEDGFIGIGGSNPHHTLDVFGDLHVTSNAFIDSNLGVGTLSPAYPVHVTSEINGVSVHASGKVAATEFNVYSDRRIKTNIDTRDPSVYLSIARSMVVREYSYVDQEEKGSLKRPGFIAQEMEAVAPEAVYTSSEYVPNVFSSCAVKSAEGSEVTLQLPAGSCVRAGDKLKCRDGSVNMFADVLSVDEQSVTAKVVLDRQLDAAELFVVGSMVHDFKMLSHDQISTIAIGAIQAQQNEISALREELAALRTEVQALRQPM